MGTQWRHAGFGQRVGLDYGMIETTANLIGVAIEPRARLFLDLKAMEDAALGFWAEEARRNG